jgi:hypothetical protein
MDIFKELIKAVPRYFGFITAYRVLFIQQMRNRKIMDPGFPGPG